MKKNVNLKVNLHLIEACNYKCRHCFAHFDKHNVLSKEDWKHIIYNAVHSSKVSSFNFAGGEPLLYPHLTSLAEYAHSLGCKCSVITNGSCIDEEWIKRNAHLFSTIGFSIDSFSPETLTSIGRCNSRGEILELERIINTFAIIKKYNPSVKIKINTVVSAINKNENLGELIKKHCLPVDRWKILRMASFENECFSNADITVTDAEYVEYISRNLSSLGIVSSNDNVLYHTDKGMEIVCENNLNGSGEIMMSKPIDGKNMLYFRHSILLFTSNLRLNNANQKKRIGFESDNQNIISEDMSVRYRETMVSQGMRREIVARFSDIVYFSPLSAETVIDIILLEIQKCAEEYGFDISYVDPSILQSLYDEVQLSGFGARMIRRIVSNHFDLLFAAQVCGNYDLTGSIDEPVLTTSIQESVEYEGQI